MFLAGDFQPLEGTSGYEFCEKVLDIVEKYNCKEIITLGGIGLDRIPKKPKIYCTGNNLNMIKKYKSKEIDNKIYGVVGPIIGVSGLITGLAQERKIPAIALLVETYGHPAHLGISASRKLLTELNRIFKFKLDLKKLDEEINNIEKEIKEKLEALEQVKKPAKKQRDTSYIG